MISSVNFTQISAALTWLCTTNTEGDYPFAGAYVGNDVMTPVCATIDALETAGLAKEYAGALALGGASLYFMYRAVQTCRKKPHATTQTLIAEYLSPKIGKKAAAKIPTEIMEQLEKAVDERMEVFAEATAEFSAVLKSQMTKNIIGTTLASVAPLLKEKEKEIFKNDGSVTESLVEQIKALLSPTAEQAALPAPEDAEEGAGLGAEPAKATL